MPTKNKIKLEFTKNEIAILVNALDILSWDLGHTDECNTESLSATAKEKKYFKAITKLKRSILLILEQME